MKIPYPIAQLLASIAERHATAIQVPMAIALADKEGGLIFFGRMDGALPASNELAVSKAFTAAALRMPTHEVGKLAQPGEMLYGIEQSHQGRIVLFGGGLPLKLQGQVAGAVGISGGTVEQDIQVAQPVVEALEEMETWSESIGRDFGANLHFDIPSLDLLSNRLLRELEKLNASLPNRTTAILTGAVLLALSSRPQPRSAGLYPV